MTALVRVLEPAERVEVFRRVFGEPLVPVLQQVGPCVLSLPIGAEPCYTLDVDRLSGEQVDRLLEHLAATFPDVGADAERELRERGLPILAAGTVYIETGGPS